VRGHRICNSTFFQEITASVYVLRPARTHSPCSIFPSVRRDDAQLKAITIVHTNAVDAVTAAAQYIPTTTYIRPHLALLRTKGSARKKCR
jgi:hypothetical protein